MTEEIYKVLDRHLEDWNTVAELKNKALQYHDTDFQKSIELMEFAKIFAETVAIIQEGERFTYNIDSAAIDLVRLAKEEKAKRVLQGRWNAKT
ncbi:MAG: hypothetical protein PHF31_07680 [Methylobacter sp.]|nr:hypothetical protein [Methylobacter sp.]